MDTSTGSNGSVEDQRKRKRMLSNRESARRSRVRKQKQLDDLKVHVAELRKERGQMVAALNVTMQRCIGVEVENSVLRTQMMELSSRLQSLNEILLYMNGCDCQDSDEGFMGLWDSMFLNEQQPIMVSLDMCDLY